jgi:hypothetical protein
VLKRLGKIAVVVVGFAGAAGIISHHQHEPGIVRHATPDPDHDHDEVPGAPPTELPGAAHVASSSQLNVVVAPQASAYVVVAPPPAPTERAAAAVAVMMLAMIRGSLWLGARVEA